MKGTPTQYFGGFIAKDTQLVLSRCSWAGDYAQACFGGTCSRRPENHVVVRYRPDWKDTPSWRNSDTPPWEWVTPEPAFSLCPGDRVYVMAEVRVIHDAPPGYGPEPWDRLMSLITRLNDGKLGWCQSWLLEVPLL